QPLTILVGRNGAGKSNFLDALAFLRDVMALNLPEAVKRRGGWSSIACRTAKVPEIEFEIEMGFECVAAESRRFSARCQYGLRLTVESKSPAVTHESFNATDEADHPVARFEVAGGNARLETRGIPPPHTSSPLDLRLDHTLLSVLGAQPYLGAGDGLRSMAFYNFHPDAMRQL